MQRIRKGDTVQVISGRDKGKRGKVLDVYAAERLVRVEGVAVRKRHIKPGSNQRFPNGGIVDRPAKIPLAKVMFYSERMGRPVRVAIVTLEGGKKVRACRGRGVERVELD